MEITLEKLLDILKKNVIFIVIVGILFGAIAFIITDFFITPVYKSHARLYVQPNSSTQSPDLLKKMTQTYITFLETEAFCENILQNVDPSISANYSASSLKSMISYIFVSNTEVFEIVITGSNPSDLFTLAEAAARLAPERVRKFDSNANLTIIEGPVKSVTETPVSPNVKNNTLIGVILGLAFSFGLVFLREIIDIKIKNADEITTRYKYPVIGRVPIFHGVKK